MRRRRVRGGPQGTAIVVVGRKVGEGEGEEGEEEADDGHGVVPDDGVIDAGLLELLHRPVEAGPL